MVNRRISDDTKSKKDTIISSSTLEFSTLPLHKISEAGSEKRLDYYLTTTFALTVNVLDKNGFAPIHYAARNNNRDMLMKLISKFHSDVNLLSKGGFTALHIAVKYKRVDCVQLLLNVGAEHKFLDASGKAPLHIAARKGCLDILQILLRSRDADVNYCSREEMNALHYAVCGGHLKVAQFLINRGVNIYKPDMSGQTPLIVACMEKNVDTLNVLIDAARKNVPSLESYLHHIDGEGSSALHMAVLNCHINNVRTLIEAGANVNYSKTDGTSALHIAAKFGFTDIAEYLLSRGADVGRQDDMLITPLFLAVQYNNTETAQVLIEAGANLNVQEESLMAPLHYAAHKGHVDSLTFLLEGGADAKIRDKSGRTVLHWAVVSEKIACITALCSKVSEEVVDQLMKVCDLNEQTALHYAAEKGLTDTVELLLKLGAQASAKDEQEKTAMHYAAEKGHTLTLETLFRHSKLEINDDDGDGRTPMLLACLNGHYSCVKTLLNFGGDVTARGRDESNYSALTLAAFEGHVEIVDLLLDNNANIEAITKFKETAMHLACKGNHTKVVALLLTRKASLCARNYKNQTPLDVAIECRSKDAAEAIVKSDRWEEAMACQDEKGRSPLPKLIVYLPTVTELLLDKCITYSGDPSFEDYSITYDFKYIDIDPDLPICKKSKVWYVNDMAEHECEQLLLHDLVKQNIKYKWNKFGMIWFWADTGYYLLVLAILSAFVMYAPNLMNHNIDAEGCPMILTEEEENNETLYQFYQQFGTKDRYNISDDAFKTLQVLRFMTFIAVGLSILRLFVAFIMLDFIVSIDTQTMVACTMQWRFAWIGILLAWFNFLIYLVRMESIGIYVIMFARVCLSVAKVIMVLFLIMVAFAFCFHITLNERVEFDHTLVALLSVMDMAIGEIKFVDRLVKADIRPFVYDNYILFGAFMVMVPIALINLLIGIAIGDIENIRNMANLKQVAMKVMTIFEYEAHNLQTLQRRWYKKSVTIYPNMPITTFLAKMFIRACLSSEKSSTSRALLRITKTIESFRKKISRSAFLPNKGWLNYSRQTAAAAESVDAISAQIDEQRKTLKTLKEQLDYHDELLRAIASRVGAAVDTRGKAVVLPN